MPWASGQALILNPVFTSLGQQMQYCVKLMFPFFLLFFCVLQLDQASLMKALQLIREHPEWNIFLYKTQEPPALLQSSDR